MTVSGLAALFCQAAANKAQAASATTVALDLMLVMATNHKSTVGRVTVARCASYLETLRHTLPFRLCHAGTSPESQNMGSLNLCESRSPELRDEENGLQYAVMGCHNETNHKAGCSLGLGVRRFMLEPCRGGCA